MRHSVTARVFPYFTKYRTDFNFKDPAVAIIPRQPLTQWQNPTSEMTLIPVEMWLHTVTQGGEVKWTLANGVGSQYSSHYLGTWCIQHYYRWCAHLGCQQSTELTPPADLNGLVRFAEGGNLVSARVPSHFKRSLLQYALYPKNSRGQPQTTFSC
jgi:hypothetical protein